MQSSSTPTLPVKQDDPDGSTNLSAVDTMLAAAMVAAAQYRASHGQDGLTVIAPDGVKVVPVREAMQGLAEDEKNMSESDKEKWTSNACRLHQRVLEDSQNVWFATRREGNIDIWQVPLEQCVNMMKDLSSKTEN